MPGSPRRRGDSRTGQGRCNSPGMGCWLLAASVVPLSTSYAIADAVGAPRLVSACPRQAPLFHDIFTLQNRDRNRSRTGAR